MKLTPAISLTLTIAAGSMLFASSASAIPKFQLPITKRGFTAESPTSIFRTPSEKDDILCTHGTTTGTIVNEDTTLVKVHFLGCSLLEGSIGPCTIKSVGAPATEGLILTELTQGLLGLLPAPGDAAAILFQPSPGRVFLTLAPASPPCKTPTSAVEGSIAGLIGVTGKRQDTGKIIFAVTSAEGGQAIAVILTLRGIIKPKLTAFGGAEVTDEHVDLTRYEEAIELD